MHKHKGMFETNHGGLAVDGEVLGKCMGGVNNKENFISKFEVGETTEQKGTSGSQKGRVTGSKRIVYAINEKNERVEIGVKVARTKSGKLGKLQTVYQWSDKMKRWMAMSIAAGIFSAFHFMGEYADYFSFDVFLIRFFAGLALGSLYFIRGFGITAWSHALYDLIVLTQTTT